MENRGLVCCQMPFLFPCLLNWKLSVTSCAPWKLVECCFICCWLLHAIAVWFCMFIYVQMSLSLLYFSYCSAKCYFTRGVYLVSMATCVLDKDISLVNANVLSVFRLSYHTVISQQFIVAFFSTEPYSTSIILKSTRRFLNQSGFVPQKLEFIKPTVHT